MFGRHVAHQAGPKWVIQVKSKGTNEEVGEDHDGQPLGDDELEDKSAAASGSGGQKGEDKVIDREKERRLRLRIVKIISATPSDLVRLLPRSGSPSSESSIVGLDLTQEYCAFIFKKLTDAARQWGLDI